MVCKQAVVSHLPNITPLIRSSLQELDYLDKLRSKNKITVPLLDFSDKIRTQRRVYFPKSKLRGQPSNLIAIIQKPQAQDNQLSAQFACQPGEQLSKLKCLSEGPSGLPFLTVHAAILNFSRLNLFPFIWEWPTRAHLITRFIKLLDNFKFWCLAWRLVYSFYKSFLRHERLTLNFLTKLF